MVVNNVRANGASADALKAGSVNGEAGLSLTKSGLDNPNPIQHGAMGQAERAFSAASTFLSGIMAISASQFIGAPLKLVDPKFYDEYMAWTKQSFAVLVTTITQWWSPTDVRVTGDDSMKGQLYQMDDGTLKCNFPHRLVLMANHQLYTDWLYLWWIAYTNKMHGRIYIILKESMKQLPIFGWGAQFYNFIFLSRKWEKDRYRFKRALNHLKNPEDPMWLLIFPEGTNLSAETREKSAAWSKKAGMPDMKHQLLPRTTGLQFCLSELQASTNWLYDCTIAYEGIPKGMYGQDVFTLRSSFLEGRPPKSVNMFWRRYRISEIPVENEAAFARWLNNRWREKDYLLEYFYKFGEFPADGPLKALAAAEGKREPHHAKMISTEVKGGGWDEFLSIFGPITTAAGALQNVDLTEPLNLDSLLAKVAEQQNLNLMDLGKSALPATSQEAIQRALMAANKKKPLPRPVIDYLVKSAPQTQQQMQQTLIRAGKETGNLHIAEQAARAPASTTQVPTKTQQNVARAAARTQQALEQIVRSPKPRAPLKNPEPAVRKALPMANMEAMVTRPLSTMAVQTAAASVRSAAAQRAKEKGAALPGQEPASKAAKGTAPIKVKPTANGIQQPNGVPKAPSGPNTAITKTKPAKVDRAAVASMKKPVPLTAAQARKQAPLGTRKYAGGKV